MSSGITTCLSISKFVKAVGINVAGGRGVDHATGGGALNAGKSLGRSGCCEAIVSPGSASELYDGNVNL